MCAEYRHLTFALDVLWYAASIYLCYRLLLHAGTLRETARDLERERNRTNTWSARPARNGWPAAWVDQILFPLVGPGVTGFVPFSSKPSELVGIRCLQAMLWVHFYRLGECTHAKQQQQRTTAAQHTALSLTHLPFTTLYLEYATDPFRREASLHMLREILLDLCPKFLFLLLWALWIVRASSPHSNSSSNCTEQQHSRATHSNPHSRIAAARATPLTPSSSILTNTGTRHVRGLLAPSFLDDLEYSLLLHTVRTYPRGLPADDLLFDRNSAERPVSPGGTQQPMARPGKQCRMPNAMAFTTMCHSLSLSISRLCLTFSLCFFVPACASTLYCSQSPSPLACNTSSSRPRGVRSQTNGGRRT